LVKEVNLAASHLSHPSRNLLPMEPPPIGLFSSILYGKTAFSPPFRGPPPSAVPCFFSDREFAPCFGWLFFPRPNPRPAQAFFSCSAHWAFLDHPPLLFSFFLKSVSVPTPSQLFPTLRVFYLFRLITFAAFLYFSHPIVSPPPPTPHPAFHPHRGGFEVSWDVRSPAPPLPAHCFRKIAFFTSFSTTIRVEAP